MFNIFATTDIFLYAFAFPGGSKKFLTSSSLSLYALALREKLGYNDNLYDICYISEFYRLLPVTRKYKCSELPLNVQSSYFYVKY